MGCFCCIKTAPILIHESSYSILKVFVKSCKASKMAEINFSFNKLKTFSCSSSHLNPTVFFIILVDGATRGLKSLTNLL